MIQVFCIKCGKELDRPGAIVLCPTASAQREAERSQLTIKYHVCENCFRPVLRWLTIVK